MSRLGWQHLRAFCATAWHDSRKDRLSQSSANLPTAIHPFCCNIDGKGYEESRCGQSKPSLSLQLAGALDHVQLATIARFYIEGLFLLILNDFTNESLPPIALSAPSAQDDISAFLCAYWNSFRTVIGKSPRQLVAESGSFASRPTTAGRHRQVFSRWLGAVPALLQLSFSRLRGVLAAARDSGVTERRGSEPTTPSAGSNSGRINKNNPNKRKRDNKSPKEPSGPRPRKTPSGSGNESDSSSEREPPGPKGKTRRAKPKGRRYACPFVKRHPFHYAKCLGQHQEGWRRVKQHLMRSHVQPIYCPTCYREFEEQQDCNKHIVARGCDQGAHADAPPAGMTPDQQRKLDNITATGDYGKWLAMWTVLFPDADPPSSPYADDLGEFMAEEVHRLFKPLCRVLLRSVMNDDLFEQYYGRLTRSSSSFLATFSGPLADRGPISSADGQPSSLTTSLEDWVRVNLEEPPDNAAQAFSPVPQTGSFTLPDDGSSFGASTSQPIDPTRNISIPQQTANHPEITVGGSMQPADESDFTWASTAIRFPIGDDNQFANSFLPVGRYQDANPHPSTSSFDGFGFGQTNTHLDVGYPRAPQIYHVPEVFQHGSSLNSFLYGPRTPQQLPTAAIPGGFMNDYGNDNFTPQMTYSPGTTSFIQAAAGRQSGGHAQEAVGDHVSGPQRRLLQQQRSQHERTGPRHF